MTLTISDALNKLKNLKSKLARTEKYINESIVHYEDEAPEYSYETEMQTRAQLLAEIRLLKTQIQETNAVTKVAYQGKDLSLTGLILANADLRSELAYTQKQLDMSANDENRYYGKRTRDDIKKKFAVGYNKQELRKRVGELEAEKEAIESLINSTNLKTNLVGT